MDRLYLFVIVLIAVGTIALVELTVKSVATQTLTSTLTGTENETSYEMSNTPKGMKNMSFSANDIRNETLGMDNSSAFANQSASSVDLTIKQ